MSIPSELLTAIDKLLVDYEHCVVASGGKMDRWRVDLLKQVRAGIASLRIKRYCAAPRCNNVIPEERRVDAQFCSERCSWRVKTMRHRERERGGNVYSNTRINMPV